MTAACGGIENAFAELLTTPTRAGEPQRKAKWAFRTQGTPGFENLALVWPEVWIREAPSAKNSGSRKAKSTSVLIIQYPNIPYGPLWLGPDCSSPSASFPMSDLSRCP